MALLPPPTLAIIKVIISTKMRLAECVARLVESKNVHSFSWKASREKPVGRYSHNWG
jgi:hypothetical protein